MKTLLLLFLSLFLYASSSQTETCIKCHPLIVSEFENSMHKRSSIYEDKIHKAIWNKHPAKKKNNYKCAKCHTPNEKQEEASYTGITCISCHTIKSIEKHSKSNKNIYETKAKTFYSAEKGRENEKLTYKTVTTWWGQKTTVGSAYHDIDYTNKQFYNGEICMGCHSHKQNAKKFTLCKTEMSHQKDTTENCITCHMPKVLGSATTVRMSKTHRYHGFAGAHVKPQMLSKYITLHLEKQEDGFSISLHNSAPHDLFTHPLRRVQLRVTLRRDAQVRELQTYTFERVIGDDGKPSMPWLATEVLKDTMIKADEKRILSFKERLQTGDRLEVKLGYDLVNPKALKKLALDSEEELKKFITLKTESYLIK